MAVDLAFVFVQGFTLQCQIYATSVRILSGRIPAVLRFHSYGESLGWYPRSVSISSFSN